MSSTFTIIKKTLRTLLGSLVVCAGIMVISAFTTVGTLTYINLDSKGVLPRSISLGGWDFKREKSRTQEVLPEKFKFGPKRDNFSA